MHGQQHGSNLLLLLMILPQVAAEILKQVEQAEEAAELRLQLAAEEAEAIEAMLRGEVEDLREQLQVSRADGESTLMEAEELRSKLDKILGARDKQVHHESMSVFFL